MSIKVENLSFKYKNGKNILSDLNFATKKGEAVFILGPNGTGKTTLLKCLCGILKPSMGKVSVEGIDISSMNVRERAKKIGYVPQKSQDVFGIDAIDIIMLGKYAGIGHKLNANDKESVFELIEKMKINDIVYKKIGEMSGGERQKIFLARALAQEPDIIVLDEPTSALDIKNQFETMELITSLAHIKNITVIMSVHDINISALFADRIIMIKDSHIFKFGVPRETITDENIKLIYGIDVSVEERCGSIHLIMKR